MKMRNWKYKYLTQECLIEIKLITQRYYELNKNNGYYGWQAGQILIMD